MSEVNKEFLTPKEVRSILAISLTTLSRWRKAGLIKTYYARAHSVLFDKAEVEALLAARTTPTLITTEESK